MLRKFSNGGAQRRRRVENARSIHVNGDAEVASAVADIGTVLGRHHAAAGEVMLIFKADQAGRARVVRLINVKSRRDLVPSEVAARVATSYGPHRHARHRGGGPHFIIEDVPALLDDDLVSRTRM